MNDASITVRSEVYFLVLIVWNWSRNSSVGISTGYGLDDQVVRVPSPCRVNNFLYVVQTGSGAHSAFYSMGSGEFFPGVKAAGVRSWPLSSIYCRGKRKCGSVRPVPHAHSRHSAYHKDNFTITVPRSRSWRYSSTILDLDTRWMLVVSFTLRPL
jgi:hypothetical protein